MNKSRNRIRLMLALVLSCAYASADTSISQLYQTNCASCHGEYGEGNQVLKAPRLAGQLTIYIQEQLKNFKDGSRGTHADDIQGQTMSASVALLNTTELDSLSRFIGRITPGTDASNATGTSNGKNTFETRKNMLDKKQLERGRLIYQTTCEACHREAGEGSENLIVPKLSILSDWYLVNQFEAYQKGWRGHAELGTSRAKAMRSILAQINEVDRKVLLNYIYRIQ